MAARKQTGKGKVADWKAKAEKAVEEKIIPETKKVVEEKIIPETKKVVEEKIIPETKKVMEEKIIPETKKVEEKVVSKVKKAVPKKEMKTTVVVEYYGKQVSEKEMIASVKKAWTKSGNKVRDIKTMALYVKPEENSVYYVINDKATGRIEF